MPTFYTDDLDIEIDEFLDELSDIEIEEVIQWLRDTNYINDTDIIQESQLSPLDNEYMSIISKLNNPLVGARLSNEDIAILKQIADKI